MNVGESQELNEAFKMLSTVEELNEKSLQQRADISYTKLSSLLDYVEKNQEIHITYYMGIPGVLLNGCLLSFYKNDAESFAAKLDALLAYKSIIIKNQNEYYKELLFGISGYLYCLLELQVVCQGQKADSGFYVDFKTCIVDLVFMILDHGIKSYGEKVDLSRLPNDFRLVYDVYKTEYFGVAHGLFGVLYMILRAYQLNSDIFNTKENSSLTNKLLICTKASLEYLLKFQTKDGNFPATALEDEKESLVQFCHGSPGAVPCLLLASEVFKTESVGERCFKSALLAGENIWNFGILKKGYGLCHGITGNAYSFLSLYRYTNDLKWLYRVYCFVLTKEDKYYQDKINSYACRGRYVVGISDYPYSLMLGLAGDICFEADCFFPKDAR